MCLVTSTKKPTKLTEDLIVYKSVLIKDNNIVSPIMNMRWILDKTYRTKMILSNCGTTYDADATWDLHELNSRYVDYLYVGQGFHWFRDFDDCGRRSYGKIARCIVPAGSLIYLDNTGLGVSNKLRIIEIL